MHLTSSSPLIEVRDLRKVYPVPGGEVVALDKINLSIDRGQIYGIIGMSGAGKSTLIRCMNRLDTPTEGQILLDGQDILAMNGKQLMQMRRKVSMIFQQFNLLMQKTVARNVRYPLEIAGVPKAKANERVKELLKIVELEGKADAYPIQLSGGQRQRVAILDGGRIAEEGTVDDVFVHTRSAAGRRLFGIVPSQQEEQASPEKPALRIVFDDGRENQPIIAGLVKHCGVEVNILSADIKRIGGKSYGQMLIEMPENTETRQKIIEFLTREGLTVKEVYPL